MATYKLYLKEKETHVKFIAEFNSSLNKVLKYFTMI